MYVGIDSLLYALFNPFDSEFVHPHVLNLLRRVVRNSNHHV